MQISTSRLASTIALLKKKGRDITVSANRFLPLLTAALCIFAGKARAAFPVAIPDPFALNTNAVGDAGDDHVPRLATDRIGHWIAVWESTDSLGGAIGTDTDILFARSTDNGASWTAPAPLNSNAGSDTGFDGVPVITTDGQGNWIAAWKSNENLGGSIGTDMDILFSRSINNGQTWSLPAPLNGNAAIDMGFDDSVEVAADDQGHFVAVWRSQIATTGPGSDGDIFVAVSMDGGMTWSSPTFLNTTGVTDTGGDDSPHIATDRQGNWLAAWTSNDTLGGTIGIDSDILCARSSDNGMTWTDPTPINTTAATDTGDDFGPRIATDRQGAWLVVWESNENLNGQTGTERDILFARSDNNGETWADPAPVNNNATTDPGVDEIPSITSDGHGNWMATWDGNNAADGMIGTEYDAFVAHSTDNGATWTDPLALNTNASGDTGDDYFALVFPDGRGNWIAVWESTENVGGQIGTDFDIFTFRFTFPDCNANGIGDGQDIADATSADCNVNGIPDSCEADSDGDGVIDACAVIAPSLLPGAVCGTCAPGMATVMATVFSLLGLFSRGRRRSRPSRLQFGLPVLAVFVLVSAEVRAQFPVILDLPAPLNTTATTDTPAEVDYNARATTDRKGNWVVLWTYDVQPSMNPVGDIMVARSADNGATWTAPATLNNNGGAGSPYDDEAQITTDGNGNWVAVWQSLAFSGTDYDIVVSRSTDNGTTWTTVAPLNTNAGSDTGDDEYPQITTDGQGHWVAVWQSTENLGGTLNTDSDIFVARSTDNGATWSLPAPLNTTAATDAANAADEDAHITTDAQGHWLSVWTARRGLTGNDEDILIARSDDNGVTWTPATPLNNNAATDSRGDLDSQISTDGQGNWLVAWLSRNDLGGTGNDGDIVAARSSDNGSTWTDPTPLNTNATTDSGLDEAVFLAADRIGNWVAVWRSTSDIGGNLSGVFDADIFVAYSADNGATWTNPALLNSKSATDTTGAEFEPHIVADDMGNWIAVWDSNDNQDGTVGTDGDILNLHFAFPDCNANGIGDGQDIADATSADCNANGIPDSCEADSDGDGIIDACAVIAPSLLPGAVCGTCAPGVLPAMGFALAIGLFGGARRRTRH